MENALAFRQTYAGEEPSMASGAKTVPTLASTSPIMGVGIHYGAALDVGSGVTIHHGNAPAAVPSTFAGVRVHRGLARGGAVAATMTAGVPPEDVTT